MSNRITVSEIAKRLEVSEKLVYRMLEERVIPNVRVGVRWIITRRAYEEWEKTCGSRPISTDDLIQYSHVSPQT